MATGQAHWFSHRATGVPAMALKGDNVQVRRFTGRRQFADVNVRELVDKWLRMVFLCQFFMVKVVN